MKTMTPGAPMGGLVVFEFSDPSNHINSDCLLQLLQRLSSSNPNRVNPSTLTIPFTSWSSCGRPAIIFIRNRSSGVCDRKRRLSIVTSVALETICCSKS